MLRRFAVFEFVSPAPSKKKHCYLRYSVPPSLGDTVIYDTWCFPASKTLLSATRGAFWPCKNIAIHNTWCLPASKTIVFTTLGAPQPRTHRYLRDLVFAGLENTAPGVLGAFCALDVAAMRLLGAICTLEIAAPYSLGTVCLFIRNC